MIGSLSGTITRVTDSILVETSTGVGYIVYVSPETLAGCQQGTNIDLFVYTHVTESSLELYGFTSYEDQKLFTLLLNVSGIGPKTAVVMSGQGAPKLTAAVQQADVAVFTAVPRVGKKLAKKIILELGSKLGTLKELELAAPNQKEQELLLALEQLGYSREVALPAIRNLPDSNLETSQALTKILQMFSK